MGLWEQSPPYLLPWETNFEKRLIANLVWLCFHGFDMWYWWVGVWKMKASHGPQGTVIFYPYIGNVNLYDWIHIVARCLNTTLLAFTMICTVSLCCYKWQQKRVDDAISLERLAELTKRWSNAMDNPQVPAGLDELIASPTNASNRPLLARDAQNHHQSTSTMQTFDDERRGSAIQMNPIRRDTEETREEGKKLFDPTVTRRTTGPPPYRRPSRTGTGLLKLGLTRWSSPTKDIDLSAPPPDYFAYEPTFPDVLLAMQLLRETTSRPKGTLVGTNMFNYHFKLPRWFIQVSIYLFTQFSHPFRPAILFAVLSHAHNLGPRNRMSFPQCLTAAIRHPAYRAVRGSEDVVLASRFLITIEPPLEARKWVEISARLALFGACSVLIIATELTIQWNEISGVKELTNVGQLIPFCLGVGGLLKVLWSAVFERDRRDEERFCYYGRCTSVHRMKYWKEASEAFRRCRDSYERSQGLPDLEEDKTTA